MIKAIIKIRLDHGFKAVVHINKTFEIPNVLGDDGLECNVKLTDTLSIKEIFYPDSLDIETNVVTVIRQYGIDISESVLKENLNAFILELENNGWSADAQQSTIDELNEPPKSKKVVKNEGLASRKPTLKDFGFTFITITTLALVFTYLFNR